MITNRTIICVASGWFDHPTSKHHIMRRLAAKNDIFWISYHASRRPTLTRRDGWLIARRLRQALSGPQRVAARIEVTAPLLAPFPGSRLARGANMYVLSRAIRRAVAARRQPAQLWLFTPDTPELASAHDFEHVVYYCVDDYAAFDGFDAALIESLEKRTLDACDRVAATSRVLHARLGAPRRDVLLCPHGVEFEHFAAAARLTTHEQPDDVRAIPAPRLGYMGQVAEYFDIELVTHAARRRPHWSFVLLGDVRRPVEPLRRLPNVHVLGPRAYAELPRYCAAFDVGVIPFENTRLVRAVNPIKLREYLAAGLPVVSTPMQDVDRYAPAVRVAERPDDFVAACDAALVDAARIPRDARQALVRGESWAARMERIERYVMLGEMDANEAPRHAAAAQPQRGESELACPALS